MRFGAEAKREFRFDHAFHSDAAVPSQEHVFTQLGSSVLANAWKGFNCSVFAYGQTGSGKTYTMGPICRKAISDMLAAAKEHGGDDDLVLSMMMN